MPQDPTIDRLVELAINNTHPIAASPQQQPVLFPGEAKSEPPDVAAGALSSEQGNPETRTLIEGALSPSTAASTSQPLSNQPPTIRDARSPPIAPIVIAAGSKHVFRDCRTAALFLLLLDEIPISDFVHWANQQRTIILQAPTKVCKEEAWKYLLLQDSSLDSTLPMLLTTTTAGSSSLDSSFTAVSGSTNKPAGTPPADRISEQEFWGFAGPRVNETGRKSDMCAAHFSSSVIAFDPPPKAKRARTLSQLPPAPSEGSETRVNSGAARSRGSTRRVPELEGVIICPDCDRKGQSIFDPNNSNPEGVVWQYFYCRNAECVRGRSSSRYIGWTTRRKG
eukprot:Gregarina_sp_Poly_1__1391@NODE_1346_length_4328_cov_111_918564_g378_i1_p2_GENE_NODE_1346_length_4328_cov_111_918564_g378_i1NODE_1346_length_4328_cov_111_918564_g378_i1_p2_ORF_typecomplete_len337_score42_20_NODE_1346_length_4328_cov_111_918564_g378_i116542664